MPTVGIISVDTLVHTNPPLWHFHPHTHNRILYVSDETILYPVPSRPIGAVE
jgi:hypothetical protein